ncbi:MAG: cytochrome b/b6 domain-containing protein [Cellvibrionaceae bacterium]
MSEQIDKQIVWDLPVRVTHWLLVVLIAFSWWTSENDLLQWHTWSGYALLVLILFRVYWGLFGSTTARFGHFVRGPKVVWRYTSQLFSQSSKPVFGHNPLAGWSTVLLLGLVLTQVLLGLFSEDVDGLASGPLSYKVSYDTGRWAAETHEDFFNVLLAFITLHITAAFFYLLYKKINLISPMITGKTPVITTETNRIAPLWRAVFGFILASLFVWWLVY